MNTLKNKKWMMNVACLAVAIFLLTAYQTTAQTRIGPVTVRIPKLPKLTRAEKPAITVAAPETSAPTGAESTADSASIGNSSRPQSDARLEILLEEINKRKKEVETYDPSERSQLVTMSTPDCFCRQSPCVRAPLITKEISSMKDSRRH
jgi:hypothetical protein